MTAMIGEPNGARPLLIRWTRDLCDYYLRYRAATQSLEARELLRWHYPSG